MATATKKQPATKKRATRKAAGKKSAPKQQPAKKKAAPKKKRANKRKPTRKRAAKKKRPPKAAAPAAAQLDEQQLLSDARQLLKSEAYERHKERANARQRQIADARKEIGPLPLIADPERRAACERNFRKFCETYFFEIFFLGWSEEQLTVIQRIEKTVLQGGMYAVAMPRGNGKTSLCEAAVIWAVLYGHHKYVLIICATDDKFKDDMRASIKTHFETNELLFEDFPEACYPIRCLEGQHNRQKGQMIEGVPTAMKWAEREKRLILPTVPGAPSSGAIIGGGGLKAGTIRGSKYTSRDGKVHRPSIAIVDDPQTDTSAEHDRQCENRERLISSAIMGTAGPGQKFSIMMPCTVIRRGDMADRMLDRDRHPEWKGHRTAMILEWPHEMEPWEKWYEIYRDVLKTDDDLDDPDNEDPAPEATAFIRKHFDAMHDGGIVSWEARKRPYNLSGLHHAMELYFRDPVGFFSEYQNWLMTPRSPGDPSKSEDLHLDPADLTTKLSGYNRGMLPPDTQWVTGYVDCHDRVLVWMLCAWSTDFTGWIIDYGTSPKTRRQSWYVGTFRPTLKEQYPGTGQDGALTAGLNDLWDDLLNRKLRRTDGLVLSPQLVPTDTAYMTGTIRRAIEARHDQRLIPSFGRIVGPNDMPMSQWKQKSGERLGENWLIRKPIKQSFRSQHLLIDTYAWKDFAARRLLTEVGDPGCVSIFGKLHSGQRHDFLARQLCAEEAKPTEGRQLVNVWDKRPGETENHWWDCFVGNCVAASVLGARVGGTEVPMTPPKQKSKSVRLNLTMPDGRGFFITDR